MEDEDYNIKHEYEHRQCDIGQENNQAHLMRPHHGHNEGMLHLKN